MIKFCIIKIYSANQYVRQLFKFDAFDIGNNEITSVSHGRWERWAWSSSM